ncbi:MAG TPA: FAD-dependent monooxygenase [Granulicella sp.]|nr:FAD-dependent monooxygenase [Granulicella sp.]
MAQSPSEFAVRRTQPPAAPGLASETWASAGPSIPSPQKHRIESHPKTDVCIVGGGPAGLACAIAAALRGLHVQVIDAAKPPIDKACGEGLMPDTLAALARLGVHLDDSTGHPLHGIRFLDADPAPSAPAAPTATAQASFPSPGRGVSRLLLHQRLLDRATELGVGLHWQTHVTSIAQPSEAIEQGAATILHTSRGPLETRFLIGADGHQSRVRAWTGLDRAILSARRIGLRQHFAIAPWTGFVEVYWSPHGQAYVTPVSPHEVCVAFIARTKFPSVAAALACFPQLQARLAAAPPSDTPRGAITLSRKLHRVTHGNIALVGDASGSVDAVTGEGLSLCFRQALALADALVANDLARYQQAHTALCRLPHRMAATLLLLDRSPRLRAQIFARFARQPQLFAHLLRVHIGDEPLRLFGRSGLLATGLHLLAA